MEELSFHSSSFPYGQVSQPFVFPRVNYCFPSLLPFLLLPSFLRTFKNFHPLQQLLSVVSTNTTLHNVQMLCKLYFGAKNLLLNLKIVKENYTPFFHFSLPSWIYTSGTFSSVIWTCCSILFLTYSSCFGISFSS